MLSGRSLDPLCKVYEVEWFEILIKLNLNF